MLGEKARWNGLNVIDIAVIAWVRCIGVFYSKPFENFIAPHATEYRYNEQWTIINSINY